MAIHHSQSACSIRSVAYGALLEMVFLTVLFSGVGSETLHSHRSADSMTLALGVSGEAKAIASKTSASIIRRQAPSAEGQALADQDLVEVSSRNGHTLISRRTASGSRYDLWSNVSQTGGHVCEHTGRTYYDLYRGAQDFAAATLENCMEHCIDKTWESGARCETMSFHGDPAQWTTANVCIAVPDPCKPILGTDSMIENATDLNWVTMNYSTWPEVPDMTGKHCDPSHSSVVHTQTLNDIETKQDCMFECKELAWCTTISYCAHTEKKECIMVSACEPANDTDSETSYANYQKGLAGA